MSSPNKLKICNIIKQLYAHNTMPKHENIALQKKFYLRKINLKRVLFLSSVPHPWGTPDMSMGYT